MERFIPKSAQLHPFLGGLSADCCTYSNGSRPDGSQRQQLTYKNGTLAYSIRIVDHQTESVADLSGISTTGNTGHWFAVDPDGSPLALRDLSLNEIYALDFEAP